jgi:hypothetical protein
MDEKESSVKEIDWTKPMPGFEDYNSYTWLGFDRLAYRVPEERLMPYTSEELDNIFTYHAPVGNQVERYQKIREAAKNLAQVIVDNTSPSPEQTLAVREVEMACMRANQCVALRG